MESNKIKNYISPNSIPIPVKRHRYWLATTNTSNYCSIIPTHPYIQWLHRLDREERVTSKPKFPELIFPI